MLWNLDHFADHIAVTDAASGSFSYTELNRLSQEVASNFTSRSLVFCLCSNTIGALLGYVGIVNGGVAVPLLLEAKIDQKLLFRLIEIYHPSHVWVPDYWQDHFPAAVEGHRSHGYVLLKLHEDAAPPMNDDLALLLTTSGSTGSPKLVRQSYRNIAANMRSISEYLEIDESQRSITSLPMSYTYGLSIINSYLNSGGTIVLTEASVVQKEFWTEFRDRNVTSFSGVPYTYGLLSKIGFLKMDLPSLVTMTQAGGKLPIDLHRKFAQYALDTGRKFYVMYGQTEATARMGYLPWQDALKKIGSMGIAIPGGAFSLIDADGAKIADADREGELVYTGANVTLGYAEDLQDLSRGDDWKGTLVTGDMAVRDEDGYYYIVGRKKRFLKIFGLRINLDEVERMIKQEFGISDVACTGTDDKLIVYVEDESAVSAVSGFVPHKFSLHPSAVTVKQIAAVPKNDAGKVLYNELPVS